MTFRTTQEVKDKWKNLQCTAKEFSGFKKEQKKIDRRPARSNPLEATLKIIEIFSKTPSFTGLEGFETGGFTDGNLVCALKSKLAIKAYFSLLVVKKHDLLAFLTRRSMQEDKKPAV